MLLYSLPDNFENFRSAIESRGELPSPESLNLKILEESEARQKRNSNDNNNHENNALISQKIIHYSKLKKDTIYNKNKYNKYIQEKEPRSNCRGYGKKWYHRHKCCKGNSFNCKRNQNIEKM